MLSRCCRHCLRFGVQAFWLVHHKFPLSERKFVFLLHPIQPLVHRASQRPYDCTLVLKMTPFQSEHSSSSIEEEDDHVEDDLFEDEALFFDGPEPEITIETDEEGKK